MSGTAIIADPVATVDSHDWIRVSPSEYVSLLTSRGSVERIEGLPSQLLGVRDCANDIVYVVDFGELARYQAADLGHGASHSV